MHRSTLVRCLVLVAALSLAACAAWQAQHAPQAETAGTGTPPPAEKPSREFKELATGTQLERVRGEVEETRWNLGSEGKYSCCVEPPCSECLLRHGECRCRSDVRTKRHACGECTEGWVEGRGVVEGVSALELLERKKEKVREKESGGETASNTSTSISINLITEGISPLRRPPSTVAAPPRSDIGPPVAAPDVQPGGLRR